MYIGICKINHGKGLMVIPKIWLNTCGHATRTSVYTAVQRFISITLDKCVSCVTLETVQCEYF